MPDTGRTDTRRAIMDAAADVFAARGFHSATVREICAKANANIALVSRYFGSKLGLYAEVCRMPFNGLGVPLAELYRNAATDKDCRVAIREWIGWAIKITSASRRNPAGYAAVRFRAGNRLLGASGYGKISAMKLQKLSVCPVAAFAQIVGGKWKILVVRELLAAPACFGVLRRALSASAKSLSKALREMEEDCLVKLAEGKGGFSYADCAANGADLWFTDSADNVIPHEIDTWNTAGESFVWVRIPEVVPAAQGVTVFTMHWGDAAEKVAHPCTTTDTWTGYLGVWHMNGIVENGVPQTETDASGNGLDATPVGYNNNTTDIRQMGRAATAVVGHARVNKNVTNANNTNGLKVPKYTGKLTDDQEYALGGWFRRTGNSYGTSDYLRLFSNQGTYTLVGGNDPANSGGDLLVFRNASASPLVFKSIDTSNAELSWTSDWVYLVFVSDGTALHIYKDGRLLKSDSNAPATVHIDNYGFTIGCTGWRKGNSLNGEYDEVRFYNGAISADRVKADYDTMSAPDKFLSFTTIATWTGAANDGDGTNSQNWECSNNGVVVAGQLPNATYRIQSCTISRNCDWSGLGTAYFAPGAVIEMNGHALTLPIASGSGTVQNSAMGDAKDLTLSVPSNWINTDVSFSGNLKLVKAGAGIFTSSKAQTYTGGTVISAGTAQPPARTAPTDLTHIWGNFKAFGTGEITVNSGGTFDVRGQYGYRNIVTLNGGTWMSTSETGIDNSRNDFSGVRRLTDDSFINVPTTGFVIGNPGDLLDLDGHTLTVSVASDKYFNTKFSYTGNPGTVILEGATGFGLTLYANSITWATNVDFRINTRINLNTNSQFHMHDYIALNTDRVIHTHSGSKLCVYGTFKPNAANNYFCGPEMQDNASIDLSGMSGPWSTTSGGSNLVDCKYVTFVNGARVNVKLGSRKVSPRVAIMTWDADSKPTNLDTLKFKGVFNDRTVTLSKRKDGLYMPRGLVIIVK